MGKTEFQTGAELLLLCGEEGVSIGEWMQRREEQLSDQSRDAIRQEMRKNLDVMRESVMRGLSGQVDSVSGLSGGDAARLCEYAMLRPYLGAAGCRAAAAAMAVVEVNASMGRIVAAPTAGASGILPGVLLTMQEQNEWADDSLIDALFCAAAVGMLAAKNASIAGADGGCQAETGVGAAMTAAALVQLKGGKPEMCLDAAAITLKNVMGLVCDPVAGLVECPCIKRNALGAVNAMLAADMALAGITSLIPFDEVIAAMRAVGHEIRPELRETALGGLAATPTGKAVAERLHRLQKT